MSSGYRVFFVHGDNVHRIAQKRFNSLYRDRSQPLLKYAGLTIVSVIVIYELEARKPDQIIRIDTRKIRFNEQGFIDQAYENEGFRLAALKVDALFAAVIGEDNTQGSSQPKDAPRSIIEASKRFDERHWNQRHPELSGPQLKNVLAGVFG